MVQTRRGKQPAKAPAKKAPSKRVATSKAVSKKTTKKKTAVKIEEESIESEKVESEKDESEKDESEKDESENNAPEPTDARQASSPGSYATNTDNLNLPTPNVSDTRVSFPRAPDYSTAVTIAQQEDASVIKTMFPIGFANLNGNVCFRNATIVMLLASPRFMSWIQDRYKPSIEQAQAIVGQQDYTDAFLRLYTLWQGWSKTSKKGRSTKVDNADLVAKKMGDFWSHLKYHEDLGSYSWTSYPGSDNGHELGSDHEDAHEFLFFLLDVARHVREENFGLNISSHDEMLQIQFANRFGCSWCRSEPGKNFRRRQATLTTENGWTIVMPQDKKPVKLEDLIARDMKAVVPNRKCPECGKKADEQEEKRRAHNECNEIKISPPQNREDYLWKRIWSLPEVLVLQLSRNQFVYGNPIKIETAIDIPEEIDLEPFVDETLVGKKSARYRLRAFVCHSGGPSAGHYIAWASINDVWYSFDDKKVTKSQLDKARKEQHSRDGQPFTPYLLLFERVVDLADEESDKPFTEEESSEDIPEEIERPTHARKTTERKETTPKRTPPKQPSPKQTSPQETPEIPSDDGVTITCVNADGSMESLEAGSGEVPPAGKVSISISVLFDGRKIQIPAILVNDIPGTSEHQALSVSLMVTNDASQRAIVSCSGSLTRESIDPKSKYDGKDDAAGKTTSNGAKSLKRKFLDDIGTANDGPDGHKGSKRRRSD